MSEVKTEKVKKPIYKKWWFWLIVVLIIGAIGANLEEDETTQGNTPAENAVPASTLQNESKPESKPETKPEEKPEPVEEVIAITAAELYQAYEDNEVAADQKYKGKTLEVSGTINNIGKDIIDRMYITLDTGDIILSVQVYFKKEHEDVIASLSKGQDVTIIGTGDGQSMNVMIKNAQIKE